MVEIFFRYNKVKFSYSFKTEEGEHEVSQEFDLSDFGITAATDFKMRELILQRAFRKWLYKEVNPQYELIRS